MHKIFIAADHAGFKLKDYLAEKVAFLGYEVFDLGPEKFLPSDDYPDYAQAVVAEVAKNHEALGILICGSGLGMAIAANKHPDIRAAACFRPLHAERARAHNNANVLCLGADFLTRKESFSIVRAFLNTNFEGGRHRRRVKKIGLGL